MVLVPSNPMGSVMKKKLMNYMKKHPKQMDAGSDVCGGFRVDQRRRVWLADVARELKVLLAHLSSVYFFVTIFVK